MAAGYDAIVERYPAWQAQIIGDPRERYVQKLVSLDPGRAMPFGRWGEPDDAARLVAWLCSDDARWITGQVIESEGGFRRWA